MSWDPFFSRLSKDERFTDASLFLSCQMLVISPVVCAFRVIRKFSQITQDLKKGTQEIHIYVI